MSHDMEEKATVLALSRAAPFAQPRFCSENFGRRLESRLASRGAFIAVKLLPDNTCRERVIENLTFESRFAVWKLVGR
jgi:hypothetical protein